MAKAVYWTITDAETRKRGEQTGLDTLVGHKKMKTWDSYKDHVKKVGPDTKRDIEKMENLAAIVSKMVEKRNDLGIAQRDLAAMCGIPQSSVARIESFQTTPNLDTLLKIMQPLGLKLVVAQANE